MVLTQTIDIPVVVSPPDLGPIRASVTFAPTSFVVAANGPAPEPRFVDTGIPVSLVPDGTAGDGTVEDDLFGENASITFPAGIVPDSTEVTIDVVEDPPAPPPSGFTTGTTFVNIELDPEPAFPLPAPGLMLVLPVSPPLTPGTALNLFRISEITGFLEPVLDATMAPIVGTVDPGGDSATFTGVVELSTVAGFVEMTTGELINFLDSLVGTGDLTEAQTQPLRAILKAAEKALDRGHESAAAALLHAFITKVSGLVRQGRIAENTGELLIDLAEQILPRPRKLEKFHREGTRRLKQLPRCAALCTAERGERERPFVTWEKAAACFWRRL